MVEKLQWRHHLRVRKAFCGEISRTSPPFLEKWEIMGADMVWKIRTGMNLFAFLMKLYCVIPKTKDISLRLGFAVTKICLYFSYEPSLRNHATAEAAMYRPMSVLNAIFQFSGQAIQACDSSCVRDVRERGRILENLTYTQLRRCTQDLIRKRQKEWMRLCDFGHGSRWTCRGAYSASRIDRHATPDISVFKCIEVKLVKTQTKTLGKESPAISSQDPEVTPTSL